MLRQVFASLLDNALKFTRTRACAEIEIGARKERDEHVFFVRDNGVGFDPRHADKLFGVFQRLHTGAEFEGTGIGLASVRRIIQRHNGRSWAESVPGKGTVVYFSSSCSRLLPMNHSIDILLVEDDPGDVRLALAVFRALKSQSDAWSSTTAKRRWIFCIREGPFFATRARSAASHPARSENAADERIRFIAADQGRRRIKAHSGGRADVFSRRERRGARLRSGRQRLRRQGNRFPDYRATLQALATYWEDVNERPPGFVERAPVGVSIERPEQRPKTRCCTVSGLWSLSAVLTAGFLQR